MRGFGRVSVILALAHVCSVRSFLSPSAVPVWRGPTTLCVGGSACRAHQVWQSRSVQRPTTRCGIRFERRAVVNAENQDEIGASVHECRDSSEMRRRHVFDSLPEEADREAACAVVIRPVRISLPDLQA